MMNAQTASLFQNNTALILKATPTSINAMKNLKNAKRGPA